MDRDASSRRPARRRHTVAPATVTVPGTLAVTVRTTQAADAELTGYVVLTRGTERRRIPYWFRTGAPALAAAKPVAAAPQRAPRRRRRAARRASRATAIPRARSGSASPDAPRTRARLPRHARPAGRQLRRRRHEPRATGPRRAADRTRRRRAAPDRLRGAAVQPQPVPAHVRRARARVRHDPARGRPVRRRLRQPVGRARRRVHVPLLDQRRHAARAGAADAEREARRRVVVAASDRGSGIDPASIVVRVDGDEHAGPAHRGRDPRRHRRPRRRAHALRLQVSDYQESRNMENVGRILPNTRILRTTFVVR